MNNHLSILALACLLTSSVTYAADERDQLKNMLLQLDAGVEVSTDQNCVEKNSFKTENCQPNQEKSIEGLTTIAHKQLSSIQSEIKEISTRDDVKNNKQHLKNISKVEKVLNCIHEKMKTVTYNCSRDSICNTATAYVFNPWGIGPNKVNLCSSYWKTPIEYQAAVMIHELSHVCGTVDHEYISHLDYSVNPNEKKLTNVSVVYTIGPDKDNHFRNDYLKSTDILSSNGDTYEFWARHGFCIPGVNCKNK